MVVVSRFEGRGEGEGTWGEKGEVSRKEDGREGGGEL